MKIIKRKAKKAGRMHIAALSFDHWFEKPKHKAKIAKRKVRK